MTEAQIHNTVLQALQNIAPEANLGELKPDARIRDQLDIDSMDFLNFVIALHTELQIDIPERDYPKLATLHGCTRYLADALSLKTA